MVQFFESNSKDEAGSSGMFEEMTQEEEESIRVWASAIPDDDGAGEASRLVRVQRRKDQQ